MKHTERVKVAVVGAGIAGLTAALRLQQAGETSLAVFEARDRVGGRTLNHAVTDGLFVEQGGQWVGPTQHRVLALADELGMATFPTPYRGRHLLALQGKKRLYRGAFPLAELGLLADFGRAAFLLQRMAWRVNRDAPWHSPDAHAFDALSFGAWLDRHVKAPTTRHLFEVISNLTLGNRPERMSLLWVLHHLQGSGGLMPLITVKGGAQEWRFVEGAQGLSLRMAERLQGYVRTAVPVDRIEWQPDLALIHAPGQVTRAEKVILAMSPPDRRRIRFEPPLSAPQQALEQQMEMAKGLKVNVVYRRPFWRDAGLSGQVLADNPFASVVYDNSHPDSEWGVLVLFVDSSRRDGALASMGWKMADPDLRKENVINALVDYFGEQARAPLHYVEKDWGEDTYCAGCIPALPPGVLTTIGPHLGRDLGPLIWAGTESSTVWNGYMEGAVRSGEQAARRALA